MNRLKQKLKSESGASILLAMLFFMICALVVSALLMAAISNAGKIKSNQEMHQKYLTVSSALELVCDDLLSAEYRGQYTVSIEEQTETPTTEPGEEPAETKVITVYKYNQIGGYYNCKLCDMLLKELDDIFATQMEADVRGFSVEKNERNEVKVNQIAGVDNITHTLTVKVAEEEDIEMQEVEVFVTLDRESYIINLTARLVDDAAYGMEAELTPTASTPCAQKQTKNGEYQTDPMTWKLGWITKASKK